MHRGDRLCDQISKKKKFLTKLNLPSQWINPLFQWQLDSHTFKGAGNFHVARMWYDELTDDIKDRIQDKGFELSLEEAIDQGACP